ncbi:hypothetical protein LEM8419_03187 [Neolewinella maritima]|uniref:Tetratricopeptide repeat protein n=1 Tax=Neolewinella maritima TaxID=1383882 RepID=A0ABM9B4J7_9BACT|nr:hypothetical protein [Neolewinella maritima]CAH1002268.1 hypothetical protein LEM8419_03187 [Neolewinella maritima]
MIANGQPTHSLLPALQAYYAGELTPSAIRQLRNLLDQQPALAREAAYYESLFRRGLLQPPPADQTEALRDRFARIEQTMHEIPTSSVRRRLYYRLAAAATILLLLAAAIWSILPPATPYVPLAVSYFSWLPREEARLGPSAAEDTRTAALTAYDRQEYAMAYPLLLREVRAGRLDSTHLRYAGVAALGAGDAEGAKRILGPLLTPGASPEQDEARYYLALAELQLGYPQRAVCLLYRLADTRGPLALRSRQLLAELGEPQGE